MDYEKAKYMEGAVWMGKRITNEIERLCQTIDSLTREFTDREGVVVHSSTTSFGLKQAGANVQWFMSALKKGSMDLYEAAITMLESAILNMEDAQRKVDSTQQENVDPQSLASTKPASLERRNEAKLAMGSGVMATMSSFKSLNNPNVASARSAGGHRVPSPRASNLPDSSRHQQYYGFAVSSGRRTHESNQSLGTYGEDKEPYFKGTARF